ncbi:MAG: spermidine synthase [Deltaproteobacteria bacterium]|nr:MAG: spermidine synthase [Deltaproteobacteria bacterium]
MNRPMAGRRCDTILARVPDPKPSRLPLLVALVTVSGACGLVYQIVWTRHFRLVFGASTAASAAVLAIFMGGLGLGGHLLGRRADRSPRPLVLYGNLELGAALLAGISPWLVDAVRWTYTVAGGQAELGAGVATLLRLLLSTLVLGPATILLGGTLPAIVRAAENEGDAARRRLGLLYGANTLGAVVGAGLATFVMIEVFGLRSSLWIAALLAALVGLTARARGRTDPAPAAAPSGVPAASEIPKTEDAASAAAPAAIVYGAACVTGFVFFAMEIVWYRMLGPLLGGSVYGFGLVLVLALVGIGVGARLYGRGAQARRPTARGFAFTCSLEALALGLPLLVGDDLVAVAYGARTWNLLGFDGLVAGWTLSAGFLVLPPALVAGYQFPLLVGLLGRGSQDVGRQVGSAYLWNTVGAIVGALVAGFGMLQLLGAVGLWRALVWILVLLAAIFAAVPLRPLRGAAGTAAVAVLAVTTTLARGPTAMWRHSPIGAGRVSFPSHDPASFERYARDVRREIVWEADGVEASFAVAARNGYAFIVTGKSDGNAKGDAPTVVMIGLLGALFHPEPQSALVVGLGTGTTAGWIADVPGMGRVDVVELEPRIADFARMCGAVNREVFDKANVEIHFGDAREYLSTVHRTYDVIVSEPSNPYRVGIASLFSQDFYRSVRERLDEDGVFVQWFQAYEVDARALRTAAATLRSVFDHVEIWTTREGDLALLAFPRPPAIDADAVARRLSEPVFAEGLRVSWGTRGLDGLVAGYLAGDATVRHLAQDAEDLIDTDDRPVLEFGFQRTLGAPYRVTSAEIRELALALGDDRPPWYAEDEPGLLWDARSVWAHGQLGRVNLPPTAPAWVKAQHRARDAAAAGQHAAAVDTWLSGQRPPRHPADLRMLARSAAKAGRPEAEAWIEELEPLFGTDARIASALLAASRSDTSAAAAELVRAFTSARTDPWFDSVSMEEAFALARRLGVEAKATARPLFESLEAPFAVHILEEARRGTRLALAAAADWPALCQEALAPFEPHAPWQANLLSMRVECYETNGARVLLERAEHDLETFLDQRPERVSDLMPEGSPPTAGSADLAGDPLGGRATDAAGPVDGPAE